MRFGVVRRAGPEAAARGLRGRVVQLESPAAVRAAGATAAGAGRLRGSR